MTSSVDWMGDDLPEPADPEVAEMPAWTAFRSQFSNYSRGARTNRIAYQTARAVALVLAAAVTVSAGVSAPPLLTAGLGAAIVVLEGPQQLFQWHVNWIAYRQAAESMRQHAIDFATGVGAYASADPAVRVATLSLARRELAVAESRSWAARMRSEPEEA
jgi:hypothetical protein